jgi:hypothetical protein
MSVVITSDRLQGYALNLVSYIENFWGMITGWEIRPANLPDWSASSDARVESEKMFFDWLRDTRRTWYGFNRRWGFHLIPTDQRKALTEDWVPPITYTLQFAKTYALPQYPQQRRRIPDPTDSLGRKRSIRVHFAEEPKKR